MPYRSRRSTKVIPPILRVRCTQPASVTTKPSSAKRKSPQVLVLYILIYIQCLCLLILPSLCRPTSREGTHFNSNQRETKLITPRVREKFFSYWKKTWGMQGESLFLLAKFIIQLSSYRKVVSGSLTLKSDRYAVQIISLRRRWYITQ